MTGFRDLCRPIYTWIHELYGNVGRLLFPPYENLTVSRTLQDPINDPSPRYWLLWPGTLMLICASFAEVACNWRSLYAAIRSAFAMILQRFSKDGVVDEIVDTVPEHERVPFWAWGSVLVLSTIVTCVVMGVQFGQNVGITLLGASSTC